MKKVIILVAALIAASTALSAQDTQKAAAEAAAALTAADDKPEVAPKPTYWTYTVLNQINFGQTSLWNWAAGGYNNYTLAAAIDATANYKKDKMIWNNRLQLDYGFMYSADKPLLQKTKDRIYFESKWSRESPVKHVSISSNFDFKTQFNNNYKYGTPKNTEGQEPTVQDWLNARTLKSGLFSPAYINLGLGVLWTPKPWFSLNVAPLTGGMVIVSEPILRYTYGMDLVPGSAQPDKKTAYEAGAYDQFRNIRYELGAQIKADLAWVINDNFSYTTQVALFYNYLTPKVEPRITWDNKVFWKLTKFFAFTVATNLIYDPLVLVRDTNKDGQPDAKGVQFKEFAEFGFTYTFTHKR